MAAFAHLGIGLAAKRAVPKVNLAVLILCAWGIDVIFGIFFLAGMEHPPQGEAASPSPWSHGLFMSVIWSMAAYLTARLLRQDKRTSFLLALLVFSHWVIDLITHPMLAAFPYDTGLPLLFYNSPLVGFGLYSYQWGVNIGEYGSLILGLAVYIFTIRSSRSALKAQPTEKTITEAHYEDLQ